jgi:hypothetical protein
MQLDPEKSEEEIVDNYREDTLYTHKFKNEAGKYFTIVSRDENNVPDAVEAEHPYPIRNKIKTTFTFIKENNKITQVSFKRFKYYKKKGYVAQDEQIVFSFSFFKQIIDYLKLLSELNLADINERRITLAEDDLPADDETKKKIKTFLLRKDGQQIIEELFNSGIITSTDIVNIGYRKKQLEIFENLLNQEDYFLKYKSEQGIQDTKPESIWQHFFEQNAWIFGYGLNYVFNEPLSGQKLEQIIQGADVVQSGKRADGLLKTRGILHSLCLVEIKTHKTKLLKQVATPYRVDCWQVSDELNGGVVQSQKTIQKTIENIKLSPVLKPSDKSGDPTGEVIFTYQPKSYLIIGNLVEFQAEHGINQEKFSSFELFRKNVLSPEIITFDELYERAKFIVYHNEQNLVK